jgi:hypothetical protein
MSNSISSIDTLLSSLTSSSLTGSSSLSDTSSYDSIFDNAIKNASTTAEKSQVAYQKTQYQDLNILFNMGSTDSSDSSTFGVSGSSSLADQVNQWSFILDQDNTTPGASPSKAAVDKAVALVAQTLITQEIMSIGKNNSSSTIDSLI